MERIAAKLVAAEGGIDFSQPHGEPAIVPPDSVSWQVFRNPVTMFIGGVAAVLLELGEPGVRTAVWEHSSFRRDPAGRLRRTGMAAMVTVYGARSRFEALAARVRGLHSRIAGETPAGKAYRADDPDLLRWVQGTAAFAFMEAYRAYVRPVSAADRDRYYAEGAAGGALYGTTDVAASEAAIGEMIAAMRPRLEASPILHELLDLVAGAEILPLPFRPMQRVVVRAAVDLLPPHLRVQLGLSGRGRLTVAERLALRMLARAADRAVFPTGPAAQACLRLGLPADYLVRGGGGAWTTGVRVPR
ncbi:MAG TPA: oxygenase MpaB family protein [Sphingomonadaceae bacterium]|nr:oxygenase MpaB family protein [Sphingomonadaceae bacterium]